MNYKNAWIYGEDFTFHKGGFTVANGIFTSMEEKDDAVDLHESYVIPGLIDIHFHGNSGFDFSTGGLEGLHRIASYLAEHGITSFAPASMTLPEETLKKAYEHAVQFRNRQPEGLARLMGINMEGPFFSHEKKGAQAEEHLILPDYDMFLRLNQAADGLIKVVCIAPELSGALEFIKKAKDICTVSLAHSTADYETAKKGFEAGATQVTHLFNAMPPFLHRAPGIVGAARDAEQVSVELICDGAHLHESVIRAAFAMFTAHRIILVSDSLSACGMPEGVYESGGQKIYMKNGAAVLEDGITFAGSTKDLFECMQMAVSFGIRPEDAIRAATINPARALGVQDRVGSISSGKQADFLICDKEFRLRECYIGGTLVS
ncbi:N-acetylglucosamine-6-phosphate deacetylase [Sinanaerobacter chloroacetimidivorans]|jgi:N-acetylglucosamine-6-phosphate deacetylase|uniref:N-acetylglucosamine-6-phosphate deacetylase n=1 Tax=Sinanaerobacter chloroacetimidivorans TaxID=2818044 RepID=A0A8J7W0Z2_9FIRM|nr:N-acetylglucosamine-6-phosphate deacetylase [Sinanaerobacter chloroacetimidivorans]MBR0598384.1 N-acetylglucosamine-6-phosphate deacetylase [Sinanaerobacter chloroacetimidivorans]